MDAIAADEDIKAGTAHLGFPPDEIHAVRTADGWKVAVSRYRARDPLREHPVLLCHGLGGNHYLFNPRPGPSLVRALNARGYDVWAVDLRGGGLSGAVARGLRGDSAATAWDFDTYLLGDVPAALDAIHRISGRNQVHWIGHSLGGVLLYSWLSRFGSDLVRSGVTVGSSLNYGLSPSEFRHFLKFRPIAVRFSRVPIWRLAHLFASLTGRFANPLERFNYWPGNVDPEMAQRIHRHYFESIPVPVLLQLATALEPEGLRSRDRSLVYREGLGRVMVPILALAADEDRQCPPSSVEDTWNRLGSKDKKLILLGTRSGQRAHYGHMDLLIGKHAKEEVFPSILEWLDDHDR